MVIHVLR